MGAACADRAPNVLHTSVTNGANGKKLRTIADP
jgi:hypothetical protein